MNALTLNKNCVYVALLLTFISAMARANSAAPVSFSQVQQLAKSQNFQAIDGLIKDQETEWKSNPDISYFQNMGIIAGGLGYQSSDAHTYWLFRKVIWEALLKPAPPSSKGKQVLKLVTVLKERFLRAAESMPPYVDRSDLKTFAAIRHDTASMLMEYSKQLHSLRIPDYKQKFMIPKNMPPQLLLPANVLNSDPNALRRAIQQSDKNEVDNLDQDELRSALLNLTDSHVQYLVDAYGREPRDQEELKQLLDALGVQPAVRTKVIESVR